MLTRVALARRYFYDSPALLAAHAIPLHTPQENEQEGEKLWQLLVSLIPVPVGQEALESDDKDEQRVKHAASSRYPYHRELQRLAEIPFSSPRGYLLSFSPDGHYIAASIGGNRLCLWDLRNDGVLPLPPLEIPGIGNYTFAPAQRFSQEKAALRLLIASEAGLFIATFFEPTKTQRFYGSSGHWDVILKQSPWPLQHIALHAETGWVALLTHSQQELSIWALSTLVQPEPHHLDAEPPGSSGGPLCLHPRIMENRLLTWSFTPEGMLLLLHGGGMFTLHDALRPGVVQRLALPDYQGSPLALLATSIDGLRLATCSKRGLILWEREAIREPFRQPRYIEDRFLWTDASAMLEFSHHGDPLVLSIFGDFNEYDWKRGTKRNRIALGAIK